MPNNKTPNCAICRWRIVKNLFVGYESRCGALGEMPLLDAYNTDECQSVFEPEPDIEPEDDNA